MPPGDPPGLSLSFLSPLCVHSFAFEVGVSELLAPWEVFRSNEVYNLSHELRVLQ